MMKTNEMIAGMVGALMVALGAGAAETYAWDGAGMKAWRTLHMCTGTNSAEALCVTTGRRDPFLYGPAMDLAPSIDHEVVIRARANWTGVGELFWRQPNEVLFPQAYAQPFKWIGDGAWHEYHIRPWWQDAKKVVQMRLDFPNDSPEGSLFDVASIRVVKKPLDGDVIGTANPLGGAVFTLPPTSRPGWADVEFTSIEGGHAKAVRTFRLAGDGRPHRHYYGGANPESWTGTFSNTTAGRHWKGRLTEFKVLVSRTGEELPLKDLVFTDNLPDIPPDLTLAAPTVARKECRAGQETRLEVTLRNIGTVAAKGVKAAITGLPADVRLVNPAAATNVKPVSGNDWRLHPITLFAERPAAFTLHVAFSGPGADGLAADIPVEILPSLGLAKETAIPEPKPLKGPFEIGAFYFPSWRHWDYWRFVWKTSPERRPLLDWYDLEGRDTMDWHIKWCVENGITFWLVDWYGACRPEGKWRNPFENEFAHARFNKYMKWALMWCNHISPGLCAEKHWIPMVKTWLKETFKETGYLYIDGKPVVSIWDSGNIERDNGAGGCRRLLEMARQMAREAGYKGIYFQTMAHPTTPDFARVCAARGFDETTIYHYMDAGGAKHEPNGFDFRLVVDSCDDYWRRMHGAGGIVHLPNLATGWDDLPWNDGCNIRGKSVAEFRRMCEKARRFGEETGTRRFCLAPLNEWGEGSYAEPNGEHGFGFYEAIRETFFEKPAEGWPLNYKPADIGLEPDVVDGQPDDLVVAWDFRGSKTRGWRNMMGIAELKPTEEGLSIVSSTADPAIDHSIPLCRLSDYWQVVVRMKASKDAQGPVRFFWAPADNRTNERMKIALPIVADGEFHDYAFRVGVMPEWTNTQIMRLRFDPCESAGSMCVVQSITLEPFSAKPVIGTANPAGGVAFTVPPRTRTSWADVEWLGDTPKDGVTVWHHFHLVGDGRERRYYFDGAQCTSFEGNGWRENARGKWKGPIREFSVRDSFTGEKLALKDVVFTDGKPDIPGELTLTATEIPLAFNRAGQDFPVEVFLFNPGTRPVAGATCEVSGLPAGVTVVNADAARNVVTLPGWDTAAHRIVLRAERSCAFTLHAAFAGGGIPPVAVDVPVKVGESLGLPKASDYIPAPKPLAKGEYEIGAYYFCDWVRPDHWMKLWRTDPKRRPALGWYDNLNPEALDWQIKWAVENGISFYLVDWYAFGAIDYFNRSFEKARFRRYMKWALMWCNHIPPEGCREEVWTNLVKGWIERYFKTPEYYQVNGMPYVSIWDPDNLDRANGGEGGCRRMLDKAREMARAAGLKGIWFQGMANEDWSPTAGRRLHAKRRTQGLDETTVYHYLGSNGRNSGFKARDYADVADSSFGYWRELAKEPGITVLPNLATGWDDHPWNDGFRVVNKSPAHFRRICESAKRLAAETGVKRFCLAPLNEWGEGSYAEPNGEFGFGFFEAIRETFFVRPAEGWPLNYTPADVGRGPYPIKNTEGVIPHPRNRIWR